MTGHIKLRAVSTWVTVVIMLALLILLFSKNRMSLSRSVETAIVNNLMGLENIRISAAADVDAFMKQYGVRTCRAVVDEEYHLFPTNEPCRAVLTRAVGEWPAGTILRLDLVTHEIVVSRPLSFGRQGSQVGMVDN